MTTTEKVTERDVLNAIGTYYGKSRGGNGQRFVVADHVRSHAGFDAVRTADCIAMDLWPSKGLALHGHEVKVSRSDWLTELKSPEKAEQFRQYVDYWWLVVSDRSIVRDDLPAGWGLMVMFGATTLIVKPARRNPAPLPVPKTFMASLLRATARTAREYEQFASRRPS